MAAYVKSLKRRTLNITTLVLIGMSLSSCGGGIFSTIKHALADGINSLYYYAQPKGLRDKDKKLGDAIANYKNLPNEINIGALKGSWKECIVDAANWIHIDPLLLATITYHESTFDDKSKCYNNKEQYVYAYRTGCWSRSCGNIYICSKYYHPYRSIDCGITQDNDENLCHYSKVPALQQLGLKYKGGNCGDYMPTSTQFDYCYQVAPAPGDSEDVIKRKDCLSFYVGAYNLGHCVYEVDRGIYHIYGLSRSAQIAACYNGSGKHAYSYGLKVEHLLKHPVSLVRTILKGVVSAF